MRLILRPSPALASAILGAHAAAAACVLLAWPGVAGVAGVTLAVLLLALGSVVAWRMALLRSAASPRALELSGEGGLSAVLRDGSRAEVAASAPRHVTRLWVVLRTGNPSCRTLIVFADMLAPPAFRRLRVWAWWGGVAGAGAADYPVSPA